MMRFRSARMEDIPELVKLWKLAFGDSESFINGFMQTAFSPDRARVAIREERIAGMLFWFDCTFDNQRWAYLYAVATDPEFQGSGVATALMEDTHVHLKRMGYGCAILSPGSEELFHFYAKRGYRTAGFLATQTVCAGAPVPAREVSSEEYGTLRRCLLPPQGVVQEGENLSYLHRFAKLLTGDDWIAAVSRYDGTVLEFLGNPDQCPGLLGYLGVPRAVVRQAGKSKPIAMVCSLNAAAPEYFYFGLPFD